MAGDKSIPKACGVFKQPDLSGSCTEITRTCQKNFEEGGTSFAINGPKKKTINVRSAARCASSAQRATRLWGPLPEFYLKGQAKKAPAEQKPSPPLAPRCDAVSHDEQDACRTIIKICESSPQGPYTIPTTLGHFQPPTQERCINLALKLPHFGFVLDRNAPAPASNAPVPVSEEKAPGPLLEPGEEEKQMLRKQFTEAVNAVRGEGRNCGERTFEAAKPVSWNELLADAALQHSRDMALHDNYEHEGTDRSTAGTRATRAGYAWRGIGENLAKDRPSVQRAVEAWVESPGHCANLMNPKFQEIGGSFAVRRSSKIPYWTLMLGRR